MHLLMSVAVSPSSGAQCVSILSQKKISIAQQSALQIPGEPNYSDFLISLTMKLLKANGTSCHSQNYLKSYNAMPHTQFSRINFFSSL